MRNCLSNVYASAVSLAENAKLGAQRCYHGDGPSQAGPEQKRVCVVA